MKKGIIALIGICALGLSLSGCSKEANDKKELKKIGITQIVEHESLDAARKGFIDELKNKGYEDGKNIVIDYQNANGDQSNNVTIADKFVNDKKDLILAIATPSAQAVAQKITDNTPILFTAVTDPVSSGLVKDKDKIEGNISGTSDLTPIKEQLDMILKFNPKAKKIGLLYCSAEDNSTYQINIAKKYLDSKNIKYEELTVQNSNDIQSVLESKLDKIDGVYIPTDNVIATAMSTVSKIVEIKKIPVVAGAVDMVKQGGVGTIGLDYYNLGKQTADMAVKILNGDKNITELPVEFSKENVTYINKDIIKKFGLDIPKEFNK